MGKILLVTIFIFSTNLIMANTKVYDKNLNIRYIKQLEITQSKESKLIAVRRKGEIKYSELKVYWTEFIKNLEEKKLNPDKVFMNKKKKLA